MPTVRTALVTVALLSALCSACAPPTEEEAALTEEQIERVAEEIHERVITVDTHDDIPPNFATEEVDPGVWGERQVTLPKMRAGGLDVGFFIVYVGQGPRDDEGHASAYEAAMTKFEAIHRMAEMYPDVIEIAFRADDVERIVGSGKLVAAIGIENGYPVGRDLSNLATFHELGGRYITLAHNGHNEIADSANPRQQLGDEEVEHDGVSEFGEQVIAEMNRLGIMVDVSHVSKKSMLDAARLSRAPVIASHSSCRALCDVARNMDDEQLLALKENGGVIQVVALGGFVKQQPERRAAILALRNELSLSFRRPSRAELDAMSDEERSDYEARVATFEERMVEIDTRYPPPNVQDFVDHIDHAVDLIGSDHVGISSDFDGGGGITGWNDASETLNVTVELVRRGYTEEEISKLWGENLLRVWRAVEEMAAHMQAAETG